MNQNPNGYDPNQPQGQEGDRNYQQYRATYQTAPDPQANYMPPYQQTGFVPETEPVMTVKDWMLTLLVLMIPCVNIIMLFVWGFSNDPGKKTRANFCKAELIWALIAAGVSVVLTVVMTLLGLSLGGAMANQFNF